MSDPITSVTIFVVGSIAADPGELTSTLLSAGLGRTARFTRGEAFLDIIDEEFDAQGEACLLLDLNVEDMPGLEVMARLRQRGSAMPVIILASQADVRSVVRAMQAGAVDFFERPIAWEILLPCVRSALEQSRRRREAWSRRQIVEARWNRLSAGERTVARMVCDGKASREIGLALGLGRRTIENRRANIMIKMGVSNVAQLVRLLCGVGPDFPPGEDSSTDAAAREDFRSERPPAGAPERDGQA